VHGLLYFVLAFLIVRLLGRGNVRFPWLAAQLETYAAIAVVASFLYGVSDEFHQNFVKGREWSELDLLADLLGASASAALWVAWRRWKSRLVLPDRRATGAGQAEV
jgi:VanZ family protein